MLNVIRIVTYLHIAPVRVANLVLDCNGVLAIKAYRGLYRKLTRCTNDAFGSNVLQRFSIRKKALVYS